MHLLTCTAVQLAAAHSHSCPLHAHLAPFGKTAASQAARPPSTPHSLQNGNTLQSSSTHTHEETVPDVSHEHRGCGEYLAQVDGCGRRTCVNDWKISMEVVPSICAVHTRLDCLAGWEPAVALCRGLSHWRNFLQLTGNRPCGLTTCSKAGDTHEQFPTRTQ